MANINYQIQGGLSLESIQRIHTEALGLIERLSLRIMHPPTLQHLANFAGVSIEKDRARSRPELVQAAIAAQWYPSPLTDREFSINTGAYELNRKIARKKITEHEYQLEAEKRRDLEAVYQRAKKETE